MTLHPAPDDLAWLSEGQREAVLAPAGPLLVVAGPGTGKTATVAERIAHLLRSGAAALPEVLALTFSRAAARALAARLVARLGPAGAAVHATTFHAFGLWLARRWAGELGLDPARLVVYGEEEARALLVEALGGDAREPPPAETLPALAAAIDEARLALAAGTAPLAGAVAPAEAYERLLRARGAIDFPGMLAAPLRLFREHPHILRRYQATYRWILADEFQDVAAPQYALLRLLAAAHSNLTVVGDTCQTLYAWRGADAAHLLDFADAHPGTRVVRLTQNFRSTGAILAVANALGAALPYGQALWTANPPGAAPVLRAARDPADEAAFIAAELARLLAAGRLDHPREAAVLARTNQQAAPLLAALGARGIPLGTAVAEDAGAWVGTIHGAKGGEWRAVFVAGLEEDLLPHRHALDAAAAGPGGAGAALAGELHAAYVAVTRPRERLYLTHCRRREEATPGGGTVVRPSRPSRFLGLLPADTLARAA
ncbi:MAG TPA: UvrD-helicase domain-containing protein [Thermomicrobiales bacterium]|nr:UvrD-helicase domain-containing protein [Thermomicrobiales bacterium]